MEHHADRIAAGDKRREPRDQFLRAQPRDIQMDRHLGEQPELFGPVLARQHREAELDQRAPRVRGAAVPGRREDRLDRVAEQLLQPFAPRRDVILMGFPRVSETFIASELLRVERAGVPVRLFVIKPVEERERGMRHPVVDAIAATPDYLPDPAPLTAPLHRWRRRHLRPFLPAIRRVGGGSRVSLNRTLGLLAALAGRPLDVRRHERESGDVTDTGADISRARDELGFEPATSVEDGLRRELEWTQSRVWATDRLAALG